MWKNLSVEDTKKLLEIRENLQGYNTSIESDYADLYNLLSDYDLQDYLYDYITIEDAEEMARDQLDSGWLARLYYFMGDVNRNCADLVRLDGYWNCEETTKDDLIDIVDDIIDDYGADADIYDEDE